MSKCYRNVRHWYLCSESPQVGDYHKEVGVAKSTFFQAMAILRGGHADLDEAICDGKMSLDEAYRRAKKRKTESPLPCPFCGSEGVLEMAHDILSGLYHFVICSNRECWVRTPDLDSAKEAMDVWQNRTSAKK